MTTTDTRRARAAAGRCPPCGAKLVPRETLCPRCRRRLHIRKRRYRRSRRGRATLRARYQAKIAAGECRVSGCHAPPAPGRRACADHLASDKLAAQLRLARDEGIIR